MMKSLRGADAARGCVAALILVLAAIPSAGPGRTAEPIKIGFGMALTGGLAANGKSALLAMKIWEEDTNANGGLLERPVRLIYYDDQSNPAAVPGLFAKLLEVDKVDLVVGDYGTNLLAPAMPVIISHNMTFIGLFGLAVNSEFNYPKYFSTFPTGPDPKTGFSKGFFQIAMAQNPKPKTIAIAAADAEFAHNAADGARLNAKAAGLQIVYDRTYPPSTVDYTPIVRAIQATNPDILYVGSYPLDSVGMVRAIKEVGLNVKLCCGGMVGLQYTAFKTQLGSLLNGIVNYDVWLPAPTMMFPGIADFLKKYQERAVAEGVDPLGYYLPPFAYAQLQILGEAVQATKSLDQNKLADYIRDHTIKTVVGDLKFGKGGEWTEPRVLQIQFQHVKGNDVEQFKNPATQVILSPKDYVSGKIIYPYADAHE